MKRISLLGLAAASIFLAACSGREETHNLSVDEARRASTYAAAFFNEDHPAGQDTQGNLIKKKGSFQTCRPQDSNANGMVTCNGLLPNMQGGFSPSTRYCGYETGSKAVLACSDKDQK